MKEESKKIKIDHNTITQNFEEHLSIDENNRILFSGPFGTGKSTFLNEFTEEFGEKYLTVKIFPVNYSVASTDDVFELIKFDLLLQLIGNHSHEITLEENDFTLLLKGQIFIMERMKFMPLLYAILGMSEKIGQPIEGFLRAMEKTVDDYKAFSDELKIDEEEDIHTYLKSIENKKGSIREMDAISELIFSILQRIKESRNGEVKSLLVIDDLDRLDPDHIFRLFNIFSAHHDEKTEANKFGFDKVVFVCDIENIRKIFHHRYGEGVDFAGYIDKFYSLSPFDFDNRGFVKEKVGILLRNIKFSENLQYYDFGRNDRFFTSVASMTMALMDAKLLNLRMIVSYPELKMDSFTFGSTGNSSQRSTTVPIVVLFHFLKNFYGSFDILESKIKYLKETFDSVNFRSKYSSDYLHDNYGDIQSIISFCLAILLPEKIAFERHGYGKETKKYLIEKNEYYLHYNTVESRDYVVFHNYYKATSAMNDGTEKEIFLNPFEVIFEAFEICRRNGIIK